MCVASSFVRKQLLKERESLHSTAPLKLVSLMNCPTETTPSSRTCLPFTKMKFTVLVEEKKVFSSKEASKPNVRNCKNCGGDHPAKLKLCPAFGRKCLYCGKLNHFEKVCCSKKASTRQGPRGQRSNAEI